ncbi:hypothetical protein ACP70R_043236 [Stipagrostis hirtigluma subsp. patula]
MQAVLRSAAGRVAGACGRRGCATAAAAEREWVVKLVQREVLDQLWTEESKVARALMRVEVAELRAVRARLRSERATDPLGSDLASWLGIGAGYAICFLGVEIVRRGLFAPK